MASISMAPNQRMYKESSVQNDASSSMEPQNLDGNVVFSKASLFVKVFIDLLTDVIG